MMISPMGYIAGLSDSTYKELMKERDVLIKNIRKLEKEIFEKPPTDEVYYAPSKEVQYQVCMEYLSELCIYMEAEYKRIYVWGEEKEE